MKKILCIIPARGGSKGIPMKNIIKLDNKPMLYYSINAAINSKYISRIIVSTDSIEITKIAEKLSAEVIKRPKRLSNDTVSALEVILYHINWIKKNYISVDNLIYLHPTSPTLKDSLIN